MILSDDLHSAQAASPPPSPLKSFGAEARTDFMLEDGLIYLNHGAFGALSHPVMSAARELRDRIEEQPSRFLTEELTGLLRNSANIIGSAYGACKDAIVFLENTTTAINAVLRSLVLFPGDEVVTTSLTYGAVLRVLEFVCDRADARLVIVHIPYPLLDPQEPLRQIEGALTARTRLVVVDHIASRAATVLPVEEIVLDCADRGIPVLIDGAHAPGMVELNIEALGATWYAGNCHKWLGAPRGSAFLWTRPTHQAVLRPTTISHRISEGYLAAFDWPGTKDFTPYLTLEDALNFRKSYGETRIYDYCHRLAVCAGSYLAERLGSHVGVPASMTGFMTTVALPISYGPAQQVFANAICTRLRTEHNIEVDIQAFEGRLWLRLSLYIYNDLSDIERLADALEALKQ